MSKRQTFYLCLSGLAAACLLRRAGRCLDGCRVVLILFGVFLAVPGWAELPGSLAAGSQVTATVQISRLGLFEAMATGLRVGIREKTDKVIEALVQSPPKDTLPPALRRWALTAGVIEGAGASALGGGGEGDLSPGLVWSLVALGMEKEGAPTEQGGGEPSSSLLRVAALAIANDVRDAYWRSATADLLLVDFDQILKEANTALLRLRAPGTVSNRPGTLQDQKILLETTEKLRKWRGVLSSAKDRLAGLVNLSGGKDAVKVLAAANELQDPGILSLPAVFLEDHALSQWALRMGLPKAQWPKTKQTEQALVAAFPGYAFAGLGHEKAVLAPPGAPSWVEAGLSLTAQLLQKDRKNKKDKIKKAGKGKESLDEETEGKVLRLVHGVGVLTQLHLALLECRLTEKRLADIRGQNKDGQPGLRAGQKDQTDSVVAGIVKKADGLILRLRQGFAFADNQVALARLLISLGRDPVPPVPDLETLAPPTLVANVAFRHKSATAALLSAMNSGIEPEVEEQLPAMAAPGLTSANSQEGLWQRMRDFSQRRGGVPPRLPQGPRPVLDDGNRGQQEVNGDAQELPVEGEMVPVLAD